MSYHQRQRGRGTGPTTSPCRYEHWWRERRLGSDQERGGSPVRSAVVPPSQPTAIFDPDEFRLIDPVPQRIADLETGLHNHSHCKRSSRQFATSISLSSDSTLLEKPPTPREYQDLPPGRYTRITRRLRYGVFAVYQRLFTFVFVVNLTAVLILLHSRSWDSSSSFAIQNLATFASSNFLLAILFRQDWFINLLFRTAWLVPWSSPLWVRTAVSRVYCYGGIHSGAAAMGTVWWIAFTMAMSWQGVTRGAFTPEMLVLTLVIASLLISIIVLSLPRLRARYHNTWELTHRFLGWLCIALFWAQTLLLTHHTSTSSLPLHKDFTHILASTPTFYILTLTTLLLIYPWLLLRRWTFTATPLSSHALQLSFPNKVHKYSCLVLSTSPLREWHPFATFPSPSTSSTGETGSSLIISAAGDWTRDAIATAQWRTKEQQLSSSSSCSSLPSPSPSEQPQQQPRNPIEMSFWLKSHPRAGVLSLSCLYPRILILTTGSGIGPSLSSLLDRPRAQSARLIWSTRSPRATYGADLLALVDKADPHALVLDTAQMGRPDLLRVAWRMYVRTKAEAVFVLSNEAVTRRVVGGLERRGVPAFGPIWDS